jgi:hypothetical protein
VLNGEATHTNVIVFGLTQPGLESTIYHTRGEHANHYTTDDFSSLSLYSYLYIYIKKIIVFSHTTNNILNVYAVIILCKYVFAYVMYNEKKHKKQKNFNVLYTSTFVPDSR